MTLRDKAAQALDNTHAAAARKLGVHTDTMREYVACWLDGSKTRTSTIRRAVKYLEMIART